MSFDKCVTARTATPPVRTPQPFLCFMPLSPTCLRKHWHAFCTCRPAVSSSGISYEWISENINGSPLIFSNAPYSPMTSAPATDSEGRLSRFGERFVWECLPPSYLALQTQSLPPLLLFPLRWLFSGWRGWASLHLDPETASRAPLACFLFLR